MLTAAQSSHIFEQTMPRVQADLVLKGLRPDQAAILASELVLSYIIEAQDEPTPILPKHSYGIKIGEGKGTINLFLTFQPNTPSE